MTDPEIRAAAAYWLIELDTAEHIEEVFPEFEKWVAQSAEHRDAYRKVERAWRALEDVRTAYRRSRRRPRWIDSSATLSVFPHARSGLISMALIVATSILLALLVLR
jgi:ferric-dicitrate binding protein FerR (iron transport regulator)